MNVCFIAPYVMKPVSGGVYTQVYHTAEALENRGITVTLFNPWESYNWKTFDLVHIFRADFDTYNITKWLHESKIPLVVTPVFYNLHNPGKIRFFLTVSRLARKLISGIRSDLDCVHDICQLSAKVLPNTIEEKKFIEKSIGIHPRKVKIIPNAVEERFADADPSLFIEKHGVKDFVLSVGNFGYPRKNMLRLIQALNQVDYPAVLIGTIYNNDYGMQCKKQMEKSKNILWLDALPHDDPLLASAYAACKVFALPSHFETPGLTALEAALAGANIVITPNGGPKGYFGHMAEYINPENSISISQGITTAFGKKPDLELKEHILRNYSYSSIAEKLIMVYKEISNKE